MLQRPLETASADHSLQRSVLEYLAGLQMQALRQIQVVVRNGTLTLSGEVHSFYEKQLLLTCRNRVPGIQRLIDRVRVVDVPQPLTA